MSIKKKKETFTVTVDEKELALAVERPSQQKRLEAQKAFNRSYKEAIDSESIVRANIYPILRSRGLWDDDKQKEKDKLDVELPKLVSQLADEKLAVEQGREVAQQIKTARARMRELNAPWNSMDVNTAEQQADNARFNRLVSLCTVYDSNGKNYFESFEDYMEKADEPVAQTAATKLMFLEYRLDEFTEENLPENKYLAKHNPKTEDATPSPAETSESTN